MSNPKLKSPKNHDNILYCNYLQTDLEENKLTTVAVVAVLQLKSAGCFMIFLPQIGLAIICILHRFA